MMKKRLARRVKLTVAYQGTMYQGWQRQPHHRSIQRTLEKLLTNLLHETVELTASGRTDAGVHALAQVAAFDHHTTFPTSRICYVLNYHLPDDIQIISAEEVTSDFHPRYNAKRKIYTYKIHNSSLKDPLKSKLYWHVPEPLDVEKMREAANYWVGEHDFCAFRSQGSSAKTTIRHIYSIDVAHFGDEISLTFEGNGFLYNMARIMTAVLVMIGKGKLKPLEAKYLLETRDRNSVPWTAPPQGLYLKKVIY
ncbi:MAG: tRNA pseudouridine(38-40) synthase TruA [Erysipelotrichaceae bacterium]|nr:tRNA pseudouridine(38-40) synthase TruA [Erysipelotrichaceae bacterium]